MKRLRLSQWSGQVLQARPRAAVSRPSFRRDIARRCQSSAAAVPESIDHFEAEEPRRPLPSPSPERALQSSKLAALHARLSLSKKIPLQSLARALINSSAEPNANFNNSSLAFLGSTIVNYHVLEYLVCKWPRLPMAILYEALRSYAGQESLSHVARRWGVEAAAAPGEEVDPGLLQWSPEGNSRRSATTAYLRAEAERPQHYRRGVSSRVVLDDAFGDSISASQEETNLYPSKSQLAHASFVQAVVGAIYTHCGSELAKAFVSSHVLSRQIDPSKFFEFKLPARELAKLCAREGFQGPIARLESETGRLSRTPVFVVGVYSGNEKLGEAAGPSLDMARTKACISALKAWYLYSPGNKVRVPSDMVEEGAKPWTPPHIDVGEIV